MKNSTDNRKEDLMEKPETYEAPSIEVIEVEIEQGFQASGGPGRDNPAW